MPLIKCPDCESDISSKAASCIHCGCPIDMPEISNKGSYNFQITKKQTIFSKDLGIAGAIYTIIFVIGLFVLAWGFAWDSSNYQLRAFGICCFIFGGLMLLIRVFKSG